MFSQTVEYALRAAVCLAQNEQKPLTTQQIAAVTRVPVSYLSKVLQLLGKANLITAVRGIGGGYMLSDPPGRVSILQVVNAIDPIRRIETCPLQLASHGTNLCPLHHKLDRIIADTEEAFQATMLAELIADQTRNPPLCERHSVRRASTLGR